jgi:hypothetical protein
MPVTLVCLHCRSSFTARPWRRQIAKYCSYRCYHQHQRAPIHIGDRFGRLVVLAEIASPSTRNRLFLCRCDCGQEHHAMGSSLMAGTTQSCGCLRREVVAQRRRTHGEAAHSARAREYRAWQAMLSRCRNPRLRVYQHYGARGIRVCERWHSYEYFLADMGRCPPGASLERIDNNGHYEPTNCRWATPREQASNRRSTRLLTAFGKTQTCAQWAAEIGITRTTLWQRLKRGLRGEDAVKPRQR